MMTMMAIPYFKCLQVIAILHNNKISRCHAKCKAAMRNQQNKPKQRNSLLIAFLHVGETFITVQE